MITLREQAREWRRRWPLIVGVARGKTVVFAAQLGPPDQAMLVVKNPRGAVIQDVTIIGAPAAGVRTPPRRTP